MKIQLMGLIAETSIHPGSGQDTGFIDLPVARESSTDYPVIVGSSFKGALRERARYNEWEPYEKEDDDGRWETEDDKKKPKTKADKIFGRGDGIGSLIVSDIRLIALPIRSLTGTYKWVTCPHLIERFIRDAKRAGIVEEFTKPEVKKEKYLGEGKSLFLEERQFESIGSLDKNIIALVKKLIPHAETKGRVEEQLVMIHDDDFAWFARYGLAVTARNILDNVTKASKNLWYEETIPPDTIFYSLLGDRQNSNALDQVKSLFEGNAYIQVGANETVGQGWLAINWLEGGK